MSHLFEYLSGSLKDVTFEVYAFRRYKNLLTERVKIIIKKMTGGNHYDG